MLVLFWFVLSVLSVLILKIFFLFSCQDTAVNGSYEPRTDDVLIDNSHSQNVA